MCLPHSLLTPVRQASRRASPLLYLLPWPDNGSGRRCQSPATTAPTTPGDSTMNIHTLDSTPPSEPGRLKPPRAGAGPARRGGLGSGQGGWGGGTASAAAGRSARGQTPARPCTPGGGEGRGSAAGERPARVEPALDAGAAARSSGRSDIRGRAGRYAGSDRAALMNRSLPAPCVI